MRWSSERQRRKVMAILGKLRNRSVVDYARTGGAVDHTQPIHVLMPDEIRRQAESQRKHRIEELSGQLKGLEGDKKEKLLQKINELKSRKTEELYFGLGAQKRKVEAIARYEVYKDHPTGLLYKFVPSDKAASQKPQPEYDPLFKKRRALQKFADVAKFGNVYLRHIKGWCMQNLSDTNPRKKQMATLMLLVNRTYGRIGNKYSAEEGTFGLTQLRASHIKDSARGGVNLVYPGKHGVHQSHHVGPEDGELVASMKELRESARARGRGAKLFNKVSPSSANRFLNSFGGSSFKDFRTFHATRIAYETLTRFMKSSRLEPKTQKDVKILTRRVCEKVQEALGHTNWGMSFNNYINPAVWNAFRKYKLEPHLPKWTETD